MDWEDYFSEFTSTVKRRVKKATNHLTGLEHHGIEEISEKSAFTRDETFATKVRKSFAPQTKSNLAFSTSVITFEGLGETKKTPFEILPTRVSKFDQLIDDNGFERGSTILLSGGAGTGKTTFSMQSIYNGAINGEKGIYLSFEEQPEKIINHMKKNYGMDFEEFIQKGLVAIIKVDPSKIARSLEESLLEKEGGLKIAPQQIVFPFVPDRICIDSLSALSIAFEKEEVYRKYLRELFESLEASQAISFVITETEQNPTVYSRTGVEEFLAEGVLVLYNLKKNTKRENALEILKLRSSRHVKGLVSYKFGSKGLEIPI